MKTAFEAWASTKDFFDTTCPYPFTSYVRQEMQIAWIAWRDSRKLALDDAATLCHCIALQRVGIALECESKLRELK